MLGGHRLTTEMKEKFPAAHIVHCSRNIQPVLSSVFRMRERSGIKMSSFSDFIRTPYREMPRIIGKCKILFDDKMTMQPRRSWIQDQPATPPELWLMTNMFWEMYAEFTITYEQMQQDQASVLDKIHTLTRWERKPSCHIEKTVG